MVQLYLFGASVLCVGVIWFFVVRPILEGFGWLAPRKVLSVSEDAPRKITSSEDVHPVVDVLSSKDGQPDGRTDSPAVTRDDLLRLYKILRKYGVPREEIRPALKGVKVALSNDVWARAEPPMSEQPADDDEIITPFAGRRTKASYYPDAPELEYQAPQG